MDDPITIGGVGGAIGSAVTLGMSLLAAWGLWRRTSHRIKLESDKSALSHFEGVIQRLNDHADRQQRQLDRQQAHIFELSGWLEQSRQVHGECWGTIEALWGYAERCHDAARRAARKSRQDPDDPDVVPPLPERPCRGEGEEFMARTLQQQARNIQQIAEEITPPIRPLTPPPLTEGDQQP